MSELGFVIVRYVKCAETNEYWKTCYSQIRKYYPTSKILIVDDASDETYLLDKGFDTTLCTVVNSEFPRRGELLGYYYFHKLKPFDKAVIIHDSVFINRQLDFDSIDKVKFLWSFDHIYDDEANELGVLEPFDEPIKDIYRDKAKWLGCYGVMSAISWTFLDEIDSKFNFFANLLPVVKARGQRMGLERIFACICTVADPSLLSSPHLLGDIHNYRWGRNISFQEYVQGANRDMPVVKILTGR